jgi:hypothetical protein
VYLSPYSLYLVRRFLRLDACSLLEMILSVPRYEFRYIHQLMRLDFSSERNSHRLNVAKWGQRRLFAPPDFGSISIESAGLFFFGS